MLPTVRRMLTCSRFFLHRAVPVRSGMCFTRETWPRIAAAQIHRLLLTGEHVITEQEITYKITDNLDSVDFTLIQLYHCRTDA